MFHRVEKKGMATALLLTLPMVAGAGTAGGDLRLVEAARNHDLGTIRSLVSQHVDVNTRSDDGSTALLWAAHWNDLDAGDLLLGAGADANTANDFRMTPLSQACTNGSDAFVRLLLKSGANPNLVIATGVTPLMTCAKSGSLDAVRRLIEYGAAINAREPDQKQTALMWATAEHHTKVVQALIEAHADLTAHSKEGFTAIHFAAREGDEECVRLLLAAGVNVNILTDTDKSAGTDPKNAASPGSAGSSAPASGAPGSAAPGSAAPASGAPVFRIGGRKTPGTLGYTPLLVATVRGQVPLALYLLDHGADPNIGAAGFTPLHWASTEWESFTANRVYGLSDPMSGIPDRQAKLQLVNALLAHGANPNARMTKPQPALAGGYEDTVGATPFLLASSIDDLEMMRILLKAGADPKQVTATNATAIMAATGLNHGIGESPITETQALETVKFLLNLGLDPKGSTTFGENALFGPAYRGWNTLLEQLIDLGVDVNAVSKAGVTPWLAAAGKGDRLGGVLFNDKGADLLLKHGADPKLGHPCEAQNKCRAE
ncbi:MAG: ankyrin repeat domain-containing protein [Bryobacterales bacterium]|nr:ankyrin repeat domain-containing protein [Bryobacterales bacterium]